MSTSTIAPAALPSAEAARYLGIAPKTLSNWRVMGKGPVYIRHGGPGGMVSYLVSDLDTYLTQHRVSGDR